MEKAEVIETLKKLEKLPYEDQHKEGSINIQWKHWNY